MRKILRFIGWILLIIVSINSIFFRFQNPEMTETQLFLALRPWMIPLLIGVVFIHLED